ncbi:MAG: DNA polymerase III subunit alpha [Candidatus Krumholzibacteriota bacterium]|nr:DNA polymerase III subunit alpha [Candidatus Krumholzibacteriota bacterium]
MAGANFVHLHNHSEYSLLDGAFRISDMVSSAKKMGMSAVALTDHGNMFGAVPFYRAAKKAGIKPILGMETYLAPGGHLEKVSVRGRTRNDHLVLLVKNDTGYRNLLKLSSIAYLEGFYYKPRIDLELLEKYSEGLIGLSACLQGSIPKLIREGKWEEARSLARRMMSIFEPGDFYIELQNHGIPEEVELLPKLVKLAGELGIRTVATNDCHFCEKDDHDAHDVLLCLQTGKDLDDPNRVLRSHSETWFKDPETMARLFAEYPESLETTLEIAGKCDFDLADTGLHLPVFPIPEPFSTAGDYLEHLVRERLPGAFIEMTEEIEERVRYELDVIRKMNYSGYFLIVWDIVNTAGEMGIPVGPGRGSAAGSIICFVLGITTIDPIKNGLLFERFLNPERVSMPDIDIDFCDEKRQKVIDHVVNKYGNENVCQIITFGRMAARAVVRDVGRVLKVPYGEVDSLAKLIPAVPGTTLAKALKNVPEFRERYDNDPQIKRLVDLSIKLEGLARHASTHAAGLVITPTRLVDHVPLYRSNKGETTTQYEMKILESIGLLKIDILGLKTLSHMDNTIELIRSEYDVDLDIESIPLDDEKTFSLLSKGQTISVFQLESSGMRELLRKIEPTTFGDITAVNALYRPGPLGSDMVTDFIECKHGRKKIKYVHPSLEPILKETYGVILYQEQVMRIASDLGGFSLGQADILRRAMGKKNEKEMARQGEAFIRGAIERGIPEKKAGKIFDLMAFFSGYGFNKSHSAAYAMISMRTAWLKAHYPDAFMAAAMTSDMGDTNRLIILLEECRNLGLKVRPPDINSSGVAFGLSGGEITYGLAAIKNIGEKAVMSAIEARKDGPFTDIYDFCDRVDLRVMNKRVLENLIQSGAMDTLPGTRAQKMASLERVMSRAQKRQSERDRGQTFLGFVEDPSVADSDRLEDAQDWDDSETLHREKESLGFYFSGHPMDRYMGMLGRIITVDSSSLTDKPNRTQVVLAGLVTESRVILDRKGKQMSFVTIEDFHGTCEAIIFSSLYESGRIKLEKDNLVVIVGKISVKDRGDTKLIADKVYSIDEAVRFLSRKVHLTLSPGEFGEKDLKVISEIVHRNSGGKDLIFHWKNNGGEMYTIRSRDSGVSPDLDMLRELRNLTGVENVEVSS